MKRLIPTILIIATLAFACARHEPAEKTYSMTATIVSRDPVKNKVTLNNQEVPGQMPAMKMDYELRGSKVGSLPPDGTLVEVTVHDQSASISVSDVKVKK